MAKTAPRTAPKGLSVFERRLANPHGAPSRDIPLADHMKGMTLRWFTQDAEHEDRHYRAVHELNYQPVKAADLSVDAKALGFTVSPDGYVVRGAKSQDMLMCMPAHEFKQIQKAKSDKNLSAVKPRKLKAEVAQATAKAHGDEAGDMIDRHFEQTEHREPVA